MDTAQNKGQIRASDYAMMNRSIIPTETDQVSIDREVSTLSDLLDGALNAIGMLESRLGLILVPTPTANGDKAPSTPHPPESQLASRIKGIISRVDVLIDGIRSIEARCQL